MKKRLFCLMTVLMLLMASVGLAAPTYTLPEKMYNQLAIGSGLKGKFRMTAEGKLAQTPFLDAVTDADFVLRGLISEGNLHCYVYQTDENEYQSALSEVYRKDGVYYLRSDMVTGKILALPAVDSLVDTVFPATGENPTLSSALIALITGGGKDLEAKGKPVISRYTNLLEMWLADFTAQADVVRKEDGTSALDFTYVIPVEQIRKQLESLWMELSEDAEVSALLDGILTAEQKNLYLNSGLEAYYQAALQALDLQKDIRMTKRISALGTVQRSGMELPLDRRTTGYDTFTMESRDGVTVYSVRNEEQTLLLATRDAEAQAEQTEENAGFQRTFWVAKIGGEALEGTPLPGEFALRVDLSKTVNQYADGEERTHQTERWQVDVKWDESCLPEGTEIEKPKDTADLSAELELHYYSRYAQNSATTLEIHGALRQGDSAFGLEAQVKTAAPWLFMPFEIVSPIRVKADNLEEVFSYAEDWVSNAVSMIHHNDEDATAASEDTATPEPQVSETSSNPG